MNNDSENDRILLDHISDCIEKVYQFTAGSKDNFMKSELIREAVTRKLQILAESTTRLSDEVKETESDIDWTGIRGFRNQVVHGYLNIDNDIIWRTVELLPELHTAVKRMKNSR